MIFPDPQALESLDGAARHRLLHGNWEDGPIPDDEYFVKREWMEGATHEPAMECISRPGESYVEFMARTDKFFEKPKPEPVIQGGDPITFDTLLKKVRQIRGPADAARDLANSVWMRERVGALKP